MEIPEYYNSSKEVLIQLEALSEKLKSEFKKQDEQKIIRYAENKVTKEGTSIFCSLRDKIEVKYIYDQTLLSISNQAFKSGTSVSKRPDDFKIEDIFEYDNGVSTIINITFANDESCTYVLDEIAMYLAENQPHKMEYMKAVVNGAKQQKEPITQAQECFIRALSYSKTGELPEISAKSQTIEFSTDFWDRGPRDSFFEENLERSFNKQCMQAFIQLIKDKYRKIKSGILNASRDLLHPNMDYNFAFQQSPKDTHWSLEKHATRDVVPANYFPVGYDLNAAPIGERLGAHACAPAPALAAPAPVHGINPVVLQPEVMGVSHLLHKEFDQFPVAKRRSCLVSQEDLEKSQENLLKRKIPKADITDNLPFTEENKLCKRSNTPEVINLLNILEPCVTQYRDRIAALPPIQTRIAAVTAVLGEERVNEALQTYEDPVTYEIPNCPVLVQGLVYDLGSLLALPQTPDSSRTLPSTRVSFYLTQIQPNRELRNQIIMEIEKLEAQAKLTQTAGAPSTTLHL